MPVETRREVIVTELTTAYNVLLIEQFKGINPNISRSSQRVS